MSTGRYPELEVVYEEQGGFIFTLEDKRIFDEACDSFFHRRGMRTGLTMRELIAATCAHIRIPRREQQQKRL